jgi:hypothetical protein
MIGKHDAVVFMSSQEPTEKDSKSLTQCLNFDNKTLCGGPDIGVESVSSAVNMDTSPMAGFV